MTRNNENQRERQKRHILKSLWLIALSSSAYRTSPDLPGS